MFGGNNDPFSGIEDLFNQLSGGRVSSNRPSRAQTQALLNTIETRKETTLIFDLSGKKVSSVSIQDDLEEDEYGEALSTGEKVITIDLGQGKTLRYNLPKNLAKRKLNHTFTNGILEVFLKK